MILSPCRKCIIRACCSIACEPGIKYARRKDLILTPVIAPFQFLIDMWKDKEWFLFGLMVCSYMGIAAQVINIVFLFIRSGEL